MKTLTELLTPVSSADIALSILADVASQTPALPTTSWQSGSVPSTLIAVFADSEGNLYTGRLNVSSGGYLGLATGDWLTLLAYQNYGISRDDAVATEGLVLLTDSGGGPYAISSGGTTVSNGSRTYRTTAGGTLPVNKSIFVPVKADVVGQAGNVPNGTITTLVTALAGVSVSNPIPWISRIGTASVLTRGYVKLTNATGGSTGVGSIVVSDGAGQTYLNVSAVTLPAGVATEVLFEAAAAGTAYNVGNGLITTVVLDGTLPGTTTCVNSAPSVNVTSWITVSGSDEQSDASLRSECQDLLLARGVDWVSSGIEYLVRQAPITSGTTITRISVITNPGGIAGKIGVYIASAAGAVLAADIDDVQEYLDDSRSLTSAVQVSTALALAITVTATASVPSAYLATAQAAAAANLAALAANTPIGGSAASGYKVQIEDIVAAIKSASYDSSGNQVNPASPTQINVTVPAADVALATTEVPVFTVSITWTGI